MEPTTDDHEYDHGTDQTERVSLEEAAVRLNISVNAVRQRIKRGTLDADRSASPWSVLWSISRSQPTPDQPPTNQPTMPADNRMLALKAEIAGRDQRITDLELDRDRWHDQAQRAGEQLEREQESVRGLIVALARAEQRAEIAEGRVDELLALQASPAASQDAPVRASAAEAPAPELLPVADVQTRTGPFWRAWWPWTRRGP
jgi:hypothetical protein